MRARLTLLDYAMHQQTERSGERPLVQDLLFGKEKRKGSPAMSSIETLIRIKKQAQTDDLVRLLDEVADYEKLSKAEAFRDLRTSEVAKKKLPLLAGAYAEKNTAWPC